MKKMILIVIVMSLFLSAFSGVSARGDNNDFYDDYSDLRFIPIVA